MRLGHMTAVLRMRASFVIFVLGMVLAMWMMLAMRGTAEDRKLLPSYEFLQSQTSSLIAKTVVSSKLRVVLVVGLEGTGHHFFEQVYGSLFKDHLDLTVIDTCFIAKGVYLDQSMKGTVSNYRQLQEAMRSGMKALAAREEHIEAPGTIVAVQRQTRKERQECPLFGQMSFPNGHGPNKALKYPDIQQVAQIAEEEGVDLRILYLQRSAKSILISSTVHEDYQQHLLGLREPDGRNPEQKFMAYAQVIMADAGVMHSMLSELGPGFVICHLYDEMANGTQVQEVADFLAPNEVVAGYLRNSMQRNVRRRKSTDEGLPFPSASTVVERIQRKLNVIEEQQCGAQAFRKR